MARPDRNGPAVHRQTAAISAMPHICLHILKFAVYLALSLACKNYCLQFSVSLLLSWHVLHTTPTHTCTINKQQRAHNRSLPWPCNGHLVDSNFMSRIIFKDMYWTIRHINQSVRLPISKFAVIHWSFTAIYHRYNYVNQIGHRYSRYYNIGFY